MSDDICPICNETVSFFSRTAVDGVICHVRCSQDLREQLRSDHSKKDNMQESQANAVNHARQIPRSSSPAIETLSIISVALLVIGLMAAMVFLIIGLTSSVSVFNAVSLAVLILFSSIIQWAVTRVFVGIAQDIRAIRKSTEQG